MRLSLRAWKRTLAALGYSAARERSGKQRRQPRRSVLESLETRQMFAPIIWWDNETESRNADDQGECSCGTAGNQTAPFEEHSHDSARVSRAGRHVVAAYARRLARRGRHQPARVR